MVVYGMVKPGLALQIGTGGAAVANHRGVANIP